MKTTTPAELAAALTDNPENVLLIDVRSPAEFASLHVKGAQNIPLDQLEAATVPDAPSPDHPIYVICQAGGRSAKGCEQLAAANLDVASVAGGTVACKTAGLPMVEGKGVISLERQVRIAAGILVLLGALASLFVHPNFIAIPLFVGAGLTFAGITDTCGMGLMLARAPWNRKA